MKRKKPKIYLTPAMKAYYDDQSAKFDVLLSKITTSDGTYRDRMQPFINRVNAMECMHAIWWRFPSITGLPSSSTHVSTLTVAMAKGVESQLRDVMNAIGGALIDYDTHVEITAAGLGRHSLHDAWDTNLQGMSEQLPIITELDVIVDRDKYFGVEHMNVELFMRPGVDLDAFQRMDRFAAMWERVTQGFEFAGESWEIIQK